MAEPRNFTVSDEDDGIRLDRWFKRNMPDVSFNLVSRWARTGQLRIDGKRAAPGDRIEAGQSIRVPPPETVPERRSEERRVGKEGRTGGRAQREKNKRQRSGADQA